MRVELHRETLDSLYYYDESSPSYLRWKVDRYCGKNLNRLIAAKGDPAGNLNPRGYWTVTVGESNAFAHRVIMALMGFDVSKCQVDHIDRNRSNNKVSNLRLVSRIVNSRNLSKRVQNSSGITGVSLIQGNWGLKAIAHWREDGRNRCKSFSVDKYGLTPALAMAARARDDSIKRLNSLGYGYSDTHGA